MTAKYGWWIALAVSAPFCGAGCAPQAALPPQPSLSNSARPPLLSTTPVAPAPASPRLELAQPGAGNWRPEVDAREWRSVVLHHTATDAGSVESIHESHLKRQWLGIGYHFVIGNGEGMPDGEVEPTFRWRQQLHGAHAGDAEHNEHGIGIALVGNFDEKPPTPAQLGAVKGLVAWLQSAYGISDSAVIGHNEVKATECPGRLLPLAEIRAGNSGQLLGWRRP